MTKREVQTGDTLDETNFREFAQKVLAKYEEKNMVVDLMVWAQIVGYYEAALKKAGV